MKRLIFCHAIVASLFFTWLVPPFSHLWTWLDHTTYNFLSPFMTICPTFWAICNSSWIDWIQDVVMLSFFTYYIFKGPKSKRLLQVVIAITIMVISITIVNNRSSVINIRRKSPTKLYKETAPRLSKQITWLDVKDKSKTCFPSDHAITTLLFTGIVFILMGRRAGILASYYALFFIVPRLVVGVHWLTDITIGSSSIALLILSYTTPLLRHASFTTKGGEASSSL